MARSVNHAPAIMTCRSCSSQGCPMATCSVPDKAAHAALEKTRRWLLPGDLLYRQGDQPNGVFSLVDGLVGLRKVSSDGRESLIGLRHPGQLFGIRAMLTNDDYLASAEVLKPSTVCFIDAAEWRSALRSNSEFSRLVMLQLATEVGVLQNKHHRTMAQTAPIRLVHLLRDLANRYGHATGDGAISFGLPLLRKDLAAVTGIRSETLSRAINTLEEQGLASFEGEQVLLRNTEYLSHLTGD